MIRYVFLFFWILFLLPALNAQNYHSVREAFAQKDKVRSLTIPEGASLTMGDWRRIMQMKNLEELNIHTSALAIIPDLIGSLGNLRRLTLDTKVELRWPEEAMPRLSGLEYLKLSGCLGEEVPGFVWGYTRLQSLIIEDESVNKSLQGLKNLRSLQELVLNLPALEAWPAEAHLLSSLRRLEVRSEGIRSIEQHAPQWPVLIDLVLHLPQLEELPGDFFNQTALEKLDLKVGTLFQLPNSLSGLTALKEWQLQAEGLPGGLPEMERLQALEKVIWVNLAPANWGSGMDNWKVLTELRLYNCDLSLFPIKSLSGLPLEYLGLHRCIQMDYNQLGPGLDTRTLIIQDDGLTQMPKKIHKLKNLTRLDITSDELKGLGKVWKSKSIRSLTLARSERMTSVPGKISRMEQLEEFHLLAPRLRSLPESLGDLSRLKRLTLRSQSWSSLPESLGRLSDLENLVLGAVRPDLIPKSVNRLVNLRSVLLYVPENMKREERAELKALFPGPSVTVRNQFTQ